MNNDLNVAALALDIVWADRDANIKKVAAMMTSLPAETDLVVLPELFSTGFINDPQLLTDLPETNSGETIRQLGELARMHNVAIAGSFLARTGPGVYNRAFFIEPSGDETFYDKRHLFSLSNEAKSMSRGDKAPAIVRFRGWNIALIVCYDLRFPAWCRSRDNSYDLLLVPANWPEARAYAWEHLLIARAIENQACVVGANRGGRDDYGSYENLTYIFDSMGKPVGSSLRPGVIYARLDRNSIDEWRRRFPVAADSDRFDLSLNFQ